MDIDINNKFFVFFLLHSIGDEMGNYFMDQWYSNITNFIDGNMIIEFIYNFIHLGGINGINISNFDNSSNNLLLLNVAKIIIENKKFDDKFIQSIKKCLINTYNKNEDNMSKNNIKLFAKYSKDIKYSNTNYDKYSFTADSCFLVSPFGLLFNTKNDLQKLIDYSIETGKIVSSSPSGYLAGFTYAYFISLTFQNVNIKKWVYKLIKLLESDKIKKHIDLTNDDISIDYLSYVRYWKTYLNIRFDDNKPIFTNSHKSFVFRMFFIQKHFTNRDNEFIGSTGISSLIASYDALLDCDGSWEKIITYSILYPAQTHITGSLACGLYGLIYGLNDVSKHMIEQYTKNGKNIKEIFENTKKYSE